ncbi:ATP-dependent DNA helicase RecG [Schaalia sp. 19OD2882]|uniref:ATP-dependent DNA helicase RecG n=1 Tax=Schaalia sp. 19OD2882 TaxID=2794089 RepID=UPI001C1EE06E|nr:ATP-dependent DNA helicase RecG [Schaalia sp. 19OD2882]QWW18909.1 ATP-dependent DNA helicase RecG [Schaalia sp. 19OD2882]
MNPLDVPLDLRLPKNTAKKLEGAGYRSVGDLLRTAPRRYYHWGRLTPMRALREGEEVTLLAEVLSQRLVANRSRGGVRLEVALTDGTDVMQAAFFGSTQWKLAVHQKLLRVGEQFLFAGKVGSYRGHLQLTHPQFEGAEGDAEEARRAAERPIPIYPAGSGVTTWVVQRAVGMLLDGLDEGAVPDPLPPEVRARHDLPTRMQALHWLHRPESDSQYRAARRALAWEEAWVLQSALGLARRDARSHCAPASRRAGNRPLEALLENLPFEMTPAQSKAVGAIGAELEGTQPMQRLLQADVGAGKTLVALAGLVQVVGAGHQGALLAPTEVLAEQHLTSLRKLLTPMEADPQTRVDVELLTSSTTGLRRRELLARLDSGDPLILVGTHALLQEEVSFADLALVVVDEQHRFGVAQRDKLRTASASGVAHQLVMTATPIPRTVAMTVFGDLDETRMRGLPPGRTPVSTHLVDAGNAAWMQRLWARAREEVDAGGRVYVVCPRIDEDDPVEPVEGEEVPPAGRAAGRVPLASVRAVAATVRDLPALAGLAVHELTGRTPSALKAQIMGDFAAGRTPVLVATTVIEVGVDVPEATMMVILDAQQFGLSQLHQLRGRVGRGSRPSICMAVHRSSLAGESLERLTAFAASTDGFELAEADLRLRREGDVLGAEQSGRSSGLRFLRVQRDADLIKSAREEAALLLEEDPTLSAHPQLLAEVRALGGEDLVWMERG